MILMMALAIMAFSRIALEAQNIGTVSGIVKYASGEPVAGAMVKVGSADLGLTFLVVSQAQGRYSTPDLLPGKYTVQGFGGGSQSEPAGSVQVRSGAQAKMDLVLSAPQKMPPPPEKPMTNVDYVKFMPAGDGKRLLLTRCTFCHGMEFGVPQRATREAWQNTVDKMRSYIASRSEFGRPLTDQERDTILDYVAKNFGPDTPPVRERRLVDPDEHLPRTLLKGAEAKYVAMELDLRHLAGVYSHAVDSQGIVWVSEWFKGGMLGRFDLKSLTYSRIALPPDANKVAPWERIYAVQRPPRTAVGAIAVDPRDQVWFAVNGSPTAQWFRYNSKSKEFKAYAVPIPPTPGGDLEYHELHFHPDGSVWAPGTSHHRIVKLDPVSEKVTEYPVPKGQHPYGMAIGGDKMIWYNGDNDNLVVKLDPSTGKLTPYKLLTPNGDLREIVADAEGNLWVAAPAAGKLTKVDYRTGKFTEYSPPTEGYSPSSVGVDTTRNLIWFSGSRAGKIGRFDPRTNSFVEFSLPSADSSVQYPQVDPTNPNRVWWNSSRIGRIGYIEVAE